MNESLQGDSLARESQRRKKLGKKEKASEQGTLTC